MISQNGLDTSHDQIHRQYGGRKQTVEYGELLCSEVYCGGTAVKVNIMTLYKLKRKCVQFTP